MGICSMYICEVYIQLLIDHRLLIKLAKLLAFLISYLLCRGSGHEGTSLSTLAKNPLSGTWLHCWGFSTTSWRILPASAPEFSAEMLSKINKKYPANLQFFSMNMVTALVKLNLLECVSVLTRNNERAEWNVFILCLCVFCKSFWMVWNI